MKPTFSMVTTVFLIMLILAMLMTCSYFTGIPVTKSDVALVISSTALFGVILILAKEIR